MRRSLVLLSFLLLTLAVPAQAAPILHLEATTTRQEFLVGAPLTVDGYLFNDGDTPRIASLGIQAPAGFDLIRISPVVTLTPTIAPQRALRSSWTYRVRADAPKGIHHFTVVAFDNAALWIPGLAVDVVIRVGPVVAPPAARSDRRVYLPTIRR